MILFQIARKIRKLRKKLKEKKIDEKNIKIKHHIYKILYL
jgi:ribosomal protein L19E